MAKRKLPGFPVDFNPDDLIIMEDPPITFKYLPTSLDSTNSENLCLLITIDGIIQILISDNNAIIIDAGSKLNSYEMAMNNEVSMAVREKGHPHKKRKVFNGPPDEKEEHNSVQLFCTSLCKQIEPYLKGKTISLCVVSYAHPDHVNLLKYILQDRKVSVYLLGGVPTNYFRNSETKSFLEFIHLNCRANPETKVYLTIRNEDLSDKMRSKNYLELFEANYITGVRIAPGEKYIDYRSSIPDDTRTDNGNWDPYRSAVEFAQFLRVGAIVVTLYAVNACMRLLPAENIYQCETMDEDQGCMIAVANLNGTSIAFTGDSNTRNQKRAAQNLCTSNDPVHILVLSRNGEYTPSSEETYFIDMNASSTKECLSEWDPKIFAIPSSCNQLTPRYELIKAIFSVIKNSKNEVKLDKHKIFMFVDRAELIISEKVVSGAGATTYKYLPAANLRSPEREGAHTKGTDTIEETAGPSALAGPEGDSRILCPRVSKIVFLSEDKHLESWCIKYNCTISHISHERDDIYRVFLTTTHPVIVLNSQAQINCSNSNCEIYQNTVTHEA